MFWKKCNHEWHYLLNDDIYINAGASVDIEDGCWIFCPSCKKEKLVSTYMWAKIKKKQDILKEYSK